MAAKGTVAKQQVISRIQKAFGNDFIGEVDKKVYVWATENGERIQIALALTCPKTPVAAPAHVNAPMVVDEGGDWDWGSESSTVTSTTYSSSNEPMVISADERKRVTDLMERLGL